MDKHEEREREIKEVVEWIACNAIYSHSPSRELIQIRESDWELLKKGIIPEDRERPVFRSTPYPRQPFGLPKDWRSRIMKQDDHSEMIARVRKEKGFTYKASPEHWQGDNNA
jgi:hypothetical protein